MTRSLDLTNADLDLSEIAPDEPVSETLELRATTRLNVSIIAPVIYTDSNGGGAGEYPATPSGNIHLLDAGVPAGGEILCTWYTLLGAWQSFRDELAAFNVITVDKANSTQVRLTVTGFAGTSRRMRIKIYTLYTTQA